MILTIYTSKSLSKTYPNVKKVSFKYCYILENKKINVYQIEI